MCAVIKKYLLHVGSFAKDEKRAWQRLNFLNIVNEHENLSKRTKMFIIINYYKMAAQGGSLDEKSIIWC